ncbi:GPO family capsid scaffolding protein [Trabulsiella odontotermitis]|uniref:GPO family capsid scaffolding protein n=1 Tax=Trabulsiella odontotermitis TaxID=379893 RepID=UPI0006766EF6|nr:GPO family capsid scaffolding protein [Trabulsiella odontotermitis]KNC89850.1 phage capsid scaffolding protein [Trabulsiella odontotermitis]
MASATKPARKKFRVAVSGTTVDGREISADHLKKAAESYKPEVYGARVNIEHYLSPWPTSDFSAMGDVTSFSTEDITEGDLSGRTALYAEIEPSDRMVQMLNDGKKVYSSIELWPQSAITGGPYLMGLAMTDTPASLGTERLKFAAQQRQQVMTFNNQQGEPAMFTEAIEAEVIELADKGSDEGKLWFGRVMNLIGKGKKSDSEQFGQIRAAVEDVAQSHADLLDRFSALEAQHTADVQTIKKLSSDLAALETRLKTTDADPASRFASTGGDGAQLADF